MENVETALMLIILTLVSLLPQTIGIATTLYLHRRTNPTRAHALGFLAPLALIFFSCVALVYASNVASHPANENNANETYGCGMGVLVYFFLFAFTLFTNAIGGVIVQAVLQRRLNTRNRIGIKLR